jgi:cytochrome c
MALNERSSRLGLIACALVAAAFCPGCTRHEPTPTSATVPAELPAPKAASGAERAGALGEGIVEPQVALLADPELAGADLERGKLLSLACAACHTFGAGEPTIIGPNLHGVFGRPAASLPDFAYSPALRASGLSWTPRTLAAWLADPQGFVSGTTMTFTGYHSAEDRRDLIAYLLRATE